MPFKLFKKKKSKPKFSLRDALAPTSAFVAVPSSPTAIPDHQSTSGNTTQQPQTFFPPEYPPQTTAPVIDGPSEGVGMYSLTVGHSELDEDGYATVNNEATIRYQQDRSTPSTSTPIQIRPSVPPNTTTVTPVEHLRRLPSVTNTLSTHSDSDNASPPLDNDRYSFPGQRYASGPIEVNSLYSRVIKRKKKPNANSQVDARKELFPDQRHKEKSTKIKSQSLNTGLDKASEYPVKTLDFDDEDYLPSNEESSTSSPVQSDEVFIPSYRKHKLSSSLNLPSHLPPSNKKRTKNPHKRTQSTGNMLDFPLNTSLAESTQQPSGIQKHQQPTGNIPETSPQTPVIKPTFIQRQGDVFVFSEQLSDGRIQYYSATPVQTPGRTHSPRSQAPSPQIPVIQSPPHALASPTHPEYHEHNQTDGAVLHPRLAESGYLSHTSHSQHQAGSVMVTSNKGGMNTSTIITPLQDSPTHIQQQPTLLGTSTQGLPQPFTPSPAKQPVISPITTPVKQAAPFTPEPHFQALSPPEQKSPKAHSSRSPLKSRPSVNDLVERYEAKSPQGPTKQKESDTLCSNLRKENELMRKSYDDLMVQSTNTSEQLQSSLNSLSSENASLRKISSQKDSQIKLLECEVAKHKSELYSVCQENKELMARQQSALEERGEWERVAAQAHSLIDENALLVKSQQVHRDTIKSLKEDHQAIVSRLHGEIAKLQEERGGTEGTLFSLRTSHNHLREQFEELSRRASQQVPLEEHQSVLMEVQRLVAELDEKNGQELKEQEAQMRISDKDKKYLVTKLTDSKAIIYQLEAEVAQLHKQNRQAHDKMMGLHRELEGSRDREINLHSQLSKAVLWAERAASERDTFARIAKSQEHAKDRALMKGVKSESKMERELEAHKQRQLEQASVILHEQDREHRQEREAYRKEISNLKSIVAKKQTYVDRLIRENQ